MWTFASSISQHSPRIKRQGRGVLRADTPLRSPQKTTLITPAACWWRGGPVGVRSPRRSRRKEKKTRIGHARPFGTDRTVLPHLEGRFESEGHARRRACVWSPGPGQREVHHESSNLLACKNLLLSIDVCCQLASDEDLTARYGDINRDR